GEMPRFFRALAEEKNETLRDFVLISLFTGARQGNILTMEWEQVDLSTATWYIPETKNGTPQFVALAPEAVSILRERKSGAGVLSRFVFEGAGKTGHFTAPKYNWYRLIKRAGISNLRMHDLRRTLGS